MADAQARAEAGGVPVHMFDLEHDERFEADPFAAWDELKTHGPLFYSPAARGFFVATDYDLIKQVLTDPVTWRSLPSQLVYTHDLIITNHIPTTAEGALHRGLREALNPLFSPKAAMALETRVVEIVHELIAPFIANGGGDFFTGFAAQLPTRFFLEWLGLPTDDVEAMFNLAMRGNYEFHDNDTYQEINRQMAALMGGVFEARKREPRDDLATKLVQMKVNGEDLAWDKLLEVGNQIFIAGQETTTSMMGYTWKWLADHPEQRRKIVDDPDLIPIALEEMFRVNSTGGSVGRNAARDTVLGGVEIKAGDRVFIARCAMDRASAPDVDLARWPNRHTAFTLGPHRCLGSNVARMEITTALREWHRLIPNYKVRDGFVPQHTHGFMQTLKSLPIEIV